MSDLLRQFPVIVICLFLSSASWASSVTATLDQEFVSACLSAFSQSSGADEHESGAKGICSCTAEERKHQGVTASELKKETAEIRKDPKYSIKNKKLLAAFQYCTVLAVEEAEHRK